MSKSNPFAPAASIQEELGVFGDAVLLNKGFLRRVIQFGETNNSLIPPSESGLAGGAGGRTGDHSQREPGQECHRFTLDYNGWWFVERVHLDGSLVWWAVSWLMIQRFIEFKIPRSLHSDIILPGDIRIEIDFGRGLKIRRFRVWLDQEIRYDEIC